MLDRFAQDVRFAFRSLAKHPGFTLTAVLTLALGVGANAAIFSVVNSVLFKKPTIRDPDRVVEIYRRMRNGEHVSISQVDLEDIRDGMTDQLEGIAAYKFFPGQIGGIDGPGTVIFGQLVNANYFAVNGVSAALGRGFLPEEDMTPETHPVLVLGHRIWRSLFGADSTVVGRQVRLNGREYTVVGVAPQSFPGRLAGLPTDVWVPMAMENHLYPSSRDANNLWATARLANGATPERLTAAMAALSASLDQERGRTERYWDFTAVPSRDVVLSPSIDGTIKAMATLLLVIVGVVLLITCTNLASFLLARATDRRKEVAVRMAMGASRGMLVRQLMTESLLLSGLGGAAGLAVCAWVVTALVRLNPPFAIPLSVDFSMDARVLAYTLAVTVAASVLFGLLPAYRATTAEIAPTLRDEAGAVAGGRGLTMRNTLVVAQIAMSLILLVSSGLFIRSLRAALKIDLGFSTGPAGIITVDGRGSGYRSDQYQDLYQRLLDGARGIAGVRSVSISDRLPATLINSGITIEVPGVENSQGTNQFYIETSTISPDYFDVLGIALRSGRSFSNADREGAPSVAIFNEAAATRFWPDQNPVGRTIRIGDSTATVVAVVADAKDRGPQETPRRMLFLPMEQNPTSTMTVLARGTVPPQRLAEELRRMALAIDPNLFIVDSKTLDQHLGVMYYLPRMGALLISIFAGLALVLACVGLYGVVSYSVARRGREMAIRLSLGARGRDVIALVVRNGMWLVLVGSGIGIALAVAAGRILQRFLIATTGLDLVTFIVVPVLLALVALTATWVPARRASRVNPMDALRAE